MSCLFSSVCMFSLARSPLSLHIQSLLPSVSDLLTWEFHFVAPIFFFLLFLIGKSMEENKVLYRNLDSKQILV